MAISVSTAWAPGLHCREVHFAPCGVGVGVTGDNQFPSCWPPPGLPSTLMEHGQPRPPPPAPPFRYPVAIDRWIWGYTTSRYLYLDLRYGMPDARTERRCPPSSAGPLPLYVSKGVDDATYQV